MAQTNTETLSLPDGRPMRVFVALPEGTPPGARLARNAGDS